MIIFGPSLNLYIPPDHTPDSPIVGIDNLVTTVNIDSDADDPDHPAVNLANPSTALFWRSGGAAAQYLTVALSGTDFVDYLGVAAHNFGTAGIAVNAQGWLGDYVVGSDQARASMPILSEYGFPLLSESGNPLYTESALPRIGDMTAAGGLAAAVDGTTSQAAAACAQKAAATSAYVGLNFSGLQGGGLRVYQAVVRGSNDAGFVSGSNPTVTLNLYAKATAPSSATDGTLIGTTNFTDTADESAGRTITSTDNTTVWVYVWLQVSVSSGATLNVAELQIYESSQNWFDLTDSETPDLDTPLIFRFNGRSDLTYIRLAMAIGTDTPQAAVIYTGRSMSFQRRVYVGHTPITMGRLTNIVNGMSESGNFLGRIIIGETRRTEVSLENLTPEWYRLKMEPFIQAAVATPFFFAWRPASYPDETGFCWLTSDAIPQNSRPNGMMSVSLSLAGIAS